MWLQQANWPTEPVDLTWLDSKWLTETELVNYEGQIISIIGFSWTPFKAKLIAVGKDRVTIRTISEDKGTDNKQLDLHLIWIWDEWRESLKVNQIIAEWGDVLFQAPEWVATIEGLELVSLIEETRKSLIDKLLTPRINVMDKKWWKLNRWDVRKQCIQTWLFDIGEIQWIVDAQIARLEALNESE